jgi:hypothetical protein
MCCNVRHRSVTYNKTGYVDPAVIAIQYGVAGDKAFEWLKKGSRKTANSCRC